MPSIEDSLRFNMELNKRACVLPDEKTWITSPTDGVMRVPLERENLESGHTTSFVKFAPGSSFPVHNHPKGEEIYVLKGIFSDENGDYPAGTYIRNPPGSQHTPFSRDGCTLFVKLDQFHPDDKKHIVIRAEERQWQQGIGNLKVLSLHTHLTESTALVHWPPYEVFQPHQHWGGEEIVVLSGKFRDEYGSYPEGTWIRSPHMSKHTPYVEKEETLILVKVGHLG